MAIRGLKGRHIWLQLRQSRGIVRRYFVVNGFDGAFTMLGLVTGFYLSGSSELSVVMGACIGAAVALGVSGLTGAYLSETAERRRSFAELEAAMVADLSESTHASAAKVMPLLVALVNGLAPLSLCLVIIAPLWMGRLGVALPLPPLLAAIATALVCIFGLGVFLGRVGGTSPLWSGLKALLIAAATVLIILLVEAA